MNWQIEPGPWSPSRGAVNRTQIFALGGSNGGTSTIYTVPSGKTFYLTTAQGSSINLVPGYFQIDYYNAAGTDTQTLLISGVSATCAGSIAVSYPMPLRFVSAEALKLICTTTQAYVTISGWIE